MKKLGTLALAAALAGSLALPTLAAESAQPILAQNGYTTQITLNGETVDTTGVPGVPNALLPLRVLAEADHGSAYWDQENNEGWFTFGDNRITVSFTDNSVSVNDQAVEVAGVEVIAGVTFVTGDVFDGLEGYQVQWQGSQGDGDNQVSITTPNGDPVVKLAYQIMDETGMAYGMRADEATLTEAYQIPADQFEQVVAFFPMITSPDTLVLGKLKEGADVEAVKQALEAYRQGQEDTFSWYLTQNLPKVQDARVVVSGDYILFLISDNADAGVAAFEAGVAAMGE